MELCTATKLTPQKHSATAPLFIGISVAGTSPGKTTTGCIFFAALCGAAYNDRKLSIGARKFDDIL
jgi:hypothetical protein